MNTAIYFLYKLCILMPLLLGKIFFLFHSTFVRTKTCSYTGRQFTLAIRGNSTYDILIISIILIHADFLVINADFINIWLTDNFQEYRDKSRKWVFNIYIEYALIQFI